MIFGRNKNHPELTRDDTVDSQGVSSARVKLDMSVGSLNVRGGAEAGLREVRPHPGVRHP